MGDPVALMDNRDVLVAKAAYNFDVDCEKIAAERGLTVVFPTDNQLQFDLDTEEAYDEFNRRLQSFNFDTPFNIENHFSASGPPHRHITLTFETESFDEYQRIALQAALGSDPIREFLNCKRLWHGVEKPTRLFERVGGAACPATPD